MRKQTLFCLHKNKISYKSAIGQHLIANPEWAKAYTEDNFWITGKSGSSFHLSVLESVYIKTKNPVLYRQKEFVFSLGLFKQAMSNRSYLATIGVK